MADILAVLVCVTFAAYGVYLRRKRLSRPCVLDAVAKIEWFAQQSREGAARSREGWRLRHGRPTT
jgi:hypothetical protein